MLAMEITAVNSTSSLLKRPFREVFSEVESAPRHIWQYEGVDVCDLDTPNPRRRYVLGMFLYPSGNAHMGHVRVYSISDAVDRLSRFRGFEVLDLKGVEVRRTVFIPGRLVNFVI